MSENPLSEHAVSGDALRADAVGADPGAREEIAEEIAEEQQAVRLQGCELEPEEMAALTAVLSRLQAQEGASGGSGAAPHPHGERAPRLARPDRTLTRRADLGLWARPGVDQWRRAAGPS